MSVDLGLCYTILVVLTACVPFTWTVVCGLDGREAAALSEDLESSLPVGVLARIPPTRRGCAMFDKKLPLARPTLHKKVPLVRWTLHSKVPPVR